MKHIVSRMSSYFPNRWPLSYLNLTKNMKTYIRRQQHKKFKHQDIKQKEPLQKYRLGTISNTKLLAGLNRFYRYLKLHTCITCYSNEIFVLRNAQSCKTTFRRFCASKGLRQDASDDVHSFLVHVATRYFLYFVVFKAWFL